MCECIDMTFCIRDILLPHAFHYLKQFFGKLKKIREWGFDKIKVEHKQREPFWIFWLSDAWKDRDIWCNLLQLVLSACVAAVKCRPVLHHCVVTFFRSSGIIDCMFVYIWKWSSAYRLGASVVWHLSLPLMNSFIKTEAAVFSFRACFPKTTLSLV